MNRILLPIVVVLIACGCRSTKTDTANLPTARFDITAFGAKGDGTTLDTGAFKNAIIACQQAGGGTVLVPRGTYLPAPLDMVSNMTLQVEEGAVILFSDNFDDYPIIDTRWEGVMREGRRPCLWARGVHDVAITGSGIIDGQGNAWWE